MSPSSIPAEPSIPAEVETFCQQHGLTEPFLQEDHWWAFLLMALFRFSYPSNNNQHSREELTLAGLIGVYVVRLIPITGVRDSDAISS